MSLDIALGMGGVPKGRIVEIYGPESSGKTTVALHMVAEVQKRGGIAGFIDAEHALDPVYARNIGVNIDELYISFFVIYCLLIFLISKNTIDKSKTSFVSIQDFINSKILIGNDVKISPCFVTFNTLEYFFNSAEISL